jgi:Cu2+-containing amine oxidase
MRRPALLTFFAIVLAASVQAQSAPQYCSSPYSVEQAFPTTGAEVSRWKLCWQVIDGPNLVITGAWFRPAPNAAWIKILYDGRLSQLFVPYHSGSPRFHDVDYGFSYVALSTSDCKPPATILGNGEVCRDVRDRGLMWKHKLKQRRGEELVLWSVLGAANYDYVIEWTFRDDGVFGVRAGMTGIIYSNQQTHLHGTIWRLDVDLNGACCDTAAIMKHQETGLSSTDSMTDVNNAAGFTWDPLGYGMLTIRDAALKNSKSKTTEFHLMPSRAGTPMHSEGFTKNTYWITPYVWSETLADELPKYVNGSPSTKNTDIVLWYYTGVHHAIRDEDRTASGSAGMTLLMFDSFMLKPFNLWSQTPFCDPASQCN